MSSDIGIDFKDSNRVKLGENNEKITSFGANCSNSVVDCFKNKCMEFYTKQLDDKSVRAYNTLNNTGKIHRSFCYV